MWQQPAVTVTACGGRGRFGNVSSVVDPWMVGGGQAATAVFGGAFTSLSRSMARRKTFFIGQALAKASLMRRTLTVTTAPIFNSLRRGHLGSSQTQASHRLHQHVGKRGEPEPELVGPHGGGTGAVGIKVELALLDAVFHLAALTVDRKSVV